MESLWVNRNLEKNGGFETLWVILRCHTLGAAPLPAIPVAATPSAQPPRLPHLQRSTLGCHTSSAAPFGCHTCSAAPWAATPAAQPHWLPHLRHRPSAAPIAAQPPGLPHLQRSRSTASLFSHLQHSPLGCLSCSAASWLPQPRCSLLGCPSRTFSMVPGVGHWPRSLRGHHCAARGASPCLVLTHLSTAAGKSCCFVASLGRRPRQTSSSGISSAHGGNPAASASKSFHSFVPSRSWRPKVQASPCALANSSMSVV